MKQILSIADQVGPLIQAARKSAGLSQTDLANRLGIKQSRVSAMELDPGSISLEQLMTICSALNLELQVQTKMRARSDSAGNSSIKAEW
ncbi:MAG: helix-turn-helix transcriptional regulator [Burkholderiaceae bacterium]|nr:helix-turn-helix transcriptional regulator [Burkholderiaceae bacterium]